jgi:hypothetical protein
MSKVYKLYTGETVFTMDGINWFMETNDEQIVPIKTRPRIEHIAFDLTNI